MKTVMITGATDGLGKALALLLSQKDSSDTQYQLAICGRSPEKMAALMEQLPSDRVFSAAFDITDKQALQSFVENAQSRFGAIDVLVNNAGANFRKSRIEDLDEDDLVNMFNLNCLAHFRCIKMLYPHMKARQSGHIINVLSSCCLHDIETMAGYTVSKQSMNAISKILTKEALEDNIRVTSFYPGGIDTSFREVVRTDYLTPESVALTISQLIELPEELNVQEYVVRPRVEKNF